ncbi:serine/threonine protein kinase [Mesorhizobium sp. BAC0120]|nr:serine/threonine protein kinase [Mesorhizobium sp. BAC0120]MDW6020733.1 serine/threonine protein kinase [Mesorhizobium sp. BAC0120]
MVEFVPETVLKRDLFSETRKGHFAGAPHAAVIRRVVTAAPFWSRPIGWVLARREIAVLRAIRGMRGVPQLHSVDSDGLYRSWTDGTPLHLARPAHPAWYRDAHRLLREFRRRGVTHNDLAKPQNWLMTPDGLAALIDFQLASRHRRKGWLFRLMAYEDFRHLLKQQRAFAPDFMTPTGRRVLARRSLPSRIWMATGKKLYNLVTRGFFRWSDGEGTHDRIDREGPGIIARLRSLPGVSDVALAPFPLPSKGVGIYAFVETAEPTALAKTDGADLVQPVAALPRRADGTPRADILQLIAMNQMTELDALVEGDPALAATAHAVAAGRLNFSDRRISRMEVG